MESFVSSHASTIDYLSIIPDRFWVDHGLGTRARFQATRPGEEILAQAMALSLPIVLHGIGLSICSGGVFDEEYLAQLASWRERYACPWVSEHLSFSRVGAGHEINAVALPVPYDREILDLLHPRIKSAQRILGCPFLLENNVSYFEFCDQDMSEAEFLNELTGRFDCSLLLDLHNVYTNSRNHHFGAEAFLANLDLSRVIEIHVAGGSEMMGFYTDSHTGAVAEEVWNLLSFVAPRSPNLGGVTFEFHESTWPLLRTEGVLDQIAKARSALAIPCIV